MSRNGGCAKLVNGSNDRNVVVEAVGGILSMGVEVVKEEPEDRSKVFPRMASWWILSGAGNVIWKLGDGGVENVQKLSDRNDVAMNSCGIVLRVSVSLVLQHLLPVGEQVVLCSLNVEKPFRWAMLGWLLWLNVKKVGKPKSRV